MSFFFTKKKKNEKFPFRFRKVNALFEKKNIVFAVVLCYNRKESNEKEEKT